MKILHIGFVVNNLFNGVRVAVPNHIEEQGKHAETAFLNVANIRLDEVSRQFEYTEGMTLDSLPDGFSSPDLVVFHEIYHLEFCKIAKQLKKRGIPYVVIPHGALSLVAQKTKRYKKIIANMLLFFPFLNGAAAVQFLSKKEMEGSLKRFRPKGFIGTNGVHSPSVQKTVFSKDGVHFVYVGRLNPFVKGIDLLTEGLVKEKTFLEEEKFTIDLYGPNFNAWWNDVLALIDRHGLNSIAFLHEPVLGKEKEEKLLSGDIFIQTSRTEGMPMGILEALSYGLPCLITRGTTLGEIIEKYDAGWVADNTAESIAEKVRQAIEEKALWETKSQNAKKLIAENFIWGKVAQDAIDTYKKIVSSEGGSR